jgi:DNA repair protein RadC
MKITDWPVAERPREKLIQQGAHALSDAELLALFLRTGTKGKTAVDIARNCLNRFGNLRTLLNADVNEFCQHHGLGQAKFTVIQAALELGKRYLHENLLRQDVLSSPQQTRSYIKARLRDYPHEVFACLFLDSQNQLIVFQEMSHGTIDCTEVYPREVVKQALQYNAAGVILAHNHPSGKAQASAADKQITIHLKQALALIHVRVLDHLIIGDGEITSFAEQGWL